MDGIQEVFGWTSQPVSTGRQCMGPSRGWWPFHSLKPFKTIPSNISGPALYFGVVKRLLKQGRSPGPALGDVN